MKKGIKIFLFGFVFLALAISLVYGADKLADEYVIEKVDGKYYIYKLVDVTDDKEIKEDKDKIDSEIKKNQDVLNLDVYSPCLDQCVKSEEYPDCKVECDIYKQEYKENIELKINELKKEKEDLNKIK